MCRGDFHYFVIVLVKDYGLRTIFSNYQKLMHMCARVYVFDERKFLSPLSSSIVVASKEKP